MTPDWGLIAAAALLSFVLAGAMIHVAKRIGLVDRPNDRSLHTAPKLRGGGVAIVVTFECVLYLLYNSSAIGPLPALVLGAGGGIVAIIGFLDDVKSRGNTVRMAVWTSVAVGSLLALGGLQVLRVGAGSWTLGVFGTTIAIIGVIWMINLYNFMDGIDGLAAAQGVFVAGVGAALLYASGSEALATLSAALGAACLGFLAWNKSPARIFMGDVGSGFLGFSFAALAILSEVTNGPPLTVWAILLAPFIGDATLTVIRRIGNREPFWVAHRSHAYQRLVQGGWSHSAVVGAVLALDVLLALAAFLAYSSPDTAVPMVALAYIVVIGAWAAVKPRPARS
ncbi:MAG: glycosyltransferase family 4 protein [Euryarchaeota archaeon]|nr:glycosyltransferase family 4 protein [Euryarchaeota archaeon]